MGNSWEKFRGNFIDEVKDNVSDVFKVSIRRVSLIVFIFAAIMTTSLLREYPEEKFIFFVFSFIAIFITLFVLLYIMWILLAILEVVFDFNIWLGVLFVTLLGLGVLTVIFVSFVEIIYFILRIFYDNPSLSEMNLFIQFLGVSFSTMVPLIVLYVTLNHNKKSNLVRDNNAVKPFLRLSFSAGTGSRSMQSFHIFKKEYPLDYNSEQIEFYIENPIKNICKEISLESLYVVRTYRGDYEIDSDLISSNNKSILVDSLVENEKYKIVLKLHNKFEDENYIPGFEYSVDLKLSLRDELDNLYLFEATIEYQNKEAETDKFNQPKYIFTLVSHSSKTKMKTT